MTNADTELLMGKREPGLSDCEPGLFQRAQDIGFSPVEIRELKRLYDFEGHPK